MQLSQKAPLDCLNCQQTILPFEEDQTSPPLCEACLHRLSLRTSFSLQSLPSLRQLEHGIAPFLMSQSRLYSRLAHEQHQETEEKQWASRLAELEREGEELRQADENAERELGQKVEELQGLCAELDKQMEGAWLEEESQSLQGEVRRLQEEVKRLRGEKEESDRFCLLSELYEIHFDDSRAYLNGEPLGHQNCRFLLEILVHLMEIYDYKTIRVNFGEGVIRVMEKGGEGVQKEVEMRSGSEEETIAWLGVVVGEVMLFWEEMRKRTPQSEGFRLPLGISVGSTILIEGVPLAPGKHYGRFLKYLAQQLKFMVSFHYAMAR